MTPFLQRVIVIAFIIFGVWIAAFFGLRTYQAYGQVREHRPPPPPFKTEEAETNADLIEDWMTIPFIEKMYHIHRGILFEALNIPVEGNQERSLKQINEKYFPDKSGFVLDLVKKTVRANLPPSPAIPPATAIPNINP